MTNTEFKKKISEAADITWFRDISETFNFDYADFVQSLTGVSAIYEFVNQQIDGWSKYEGKIPNELQKSKIYFNEIKQQIIQFVNSHINTKGSNLNSYWQSVKNNIASTNQKPLPYNSPHAEFLIKVHNETPQYFLGAYYLLLGTNNYNANNREQLFGAILAYEYKLKDHTDIPDRRNFEKNSISKIRSDFQKYLSDSEKQVIDHLNNSNAKYSEYVTLIDNFKNEKEELFNKWFEHTKKEEWKKWYDEKLLTLKKLEETYETKLKLEKPARYWEKKSSKYYLQGVAARKLLIWVIVVAAVFLGLILFFSPDWIFKNVFKGNEISIVRWSIVFITLLSLIAYAIKALSKYMFSSFHLARDAEERHTLTFFYLALLKDTEVKDEDRKMILQSLFSRTDTGLLKEDSGPTMPNDNISRIISR